MILLRWNQRTEAALARIASTSSETLPDSIFGLPGGRDIEKFNIEMRKFLKKMGITPQRLIEQQVGDAIAAGKIEGNEQLEVRATLETEGLALKEPIDGKIRLE